MRRTTFWMALLMGLLMMSAPMAVAGKGGKGKPGGGGGGSPSPIDALPGVVVFQTDKNSSTEAWWACAPNGESLREIPAPPSEPRWVSVSPYPVHLMTGEGHIRPLEAATPVVTMSASMFSSYLTDGLEHISRPQFRYRSEAAGLGSEIDEVLFQGASQVGTDVSGNPIWSYDYYSAPLVRDSQGIVTAVDAANVSKLAPLPYLSLGFGGGHRHHLAPDGMRIVYAERESNGSGGFTNLDGGIYTFDVTTPGSAEAYPEFDVQSETCFRRVAWAPNPALDRFFYELDGPCGLENTNDGKSIYRDLVVADPDTGDTHVVLSSPVTGGYGSTAWSPDGTFILLVGPGRKSKGVTLSDLYRVSAAGTDAPVRAVRVSEIGRLSNTLWGAQIDFGGELAEPERRGAARRRVLSALPGDR